MPTYKALFARSPYIHTITGTAGQETMVELYIWNDPDSAPVSPQKILRKTIVSGTNTYYDISPFVRKYMNFGAFTEVTSDTAASTENYCKMISKEYSNGSLVRTSYFVCFDGYGYFEEGRNPYSGQTVPGMMTEGTYYVRDDGNCGGVYYFDDQVYTWEAKWTGLSTGGTTTVTLAQEIGYVPYLHPSYVAEGNKLEMIRNSVVQSTYYFKPECEPRYTPVVCDFVNKFGVWQQLIFFKRNKKMYDMKNEQFNLYPSASDYATDENITQTFNTNMVESITCNTGWVNDSYAEVLKQLMLSEKIRLDGQPVVLKTKSIEPKYHLTSKVDINYEVQFMYAFNELNYVI